MVCNIMKAEYIKAEIAKDRAGYFRKADEALEMIRKQYGDGPEGLRRFLERKPKHVENFNENQPDKE